MKYTEKKSMVPEIITDETKVTLKGAEEYYTYLRNRFGFNEYGDGKYARVIFRPEMHYEEGSNDWYFTAKVECGIRMMGDLSAEDMLKAADEMKAAAKVAEKMMEKFDGVKLVRK